MDRVSWIIYNNLISFFIRHNGENHQRVNKIVKIYNSSGMFDQWDQMSVFLNIRDFEVIYVW